MSQIKRCGFCGHDIINRSVSREYTQGGETGTTLLHIGCNWIWTNYDTTAAISPDSCQTALEDVGLAELTGHEHMVELAANDREFVFARWREANYLGDEWYARAMALAEENGNNEAIEEAFREAVRYLASEKHVVGLLGFQAGLQDQENVIDS